MVEEVEEEVGVTVWRRKVEKRPKEKLLCICRHYTCRVQRVAQSHVQVADNLSVTLDFTFDKRRDRKSLFKTTNLLFPAANSETR